MRTATTRLPGHPDAVSDLVVEAVVDEYLRRDANARLAISASGGRGVFFLSGDVSSEADFDVSALVKRTLGQLGAEDAEVFVSLEPVPAERLFAFKNGESPVTVIGYATAETDDRLPATVSLSRRVAKRLEEKRTSDPEWFWLGPDADVTVVASGTKPERVIVMLDHGNEPLGTVRDRVSNELAVIADGAIINANPSGERAGRGTGRMSGASGRLASSYGSAIPSGPSIIGLDPRRAEKAGAWLARAAARSVVASGAKAAMVQATYFPGDRSPSLISVRDERGADRSAAISRDRLHLDRVMKEWWRPGLNLDAARWGFAGEPGMPWEG